jgi:hypothetical protein
MSDLQDLIHKTSINCIEQGKLVERERIIKLLTNKYAELVKANRWAESNHYLQTVSLIREETK